MRGIQRLTPIAWRLAGRSRGAKLVLMYHRVAELDTDPWNLAVSPSHFDEHLQVLRAAYQTTFARQVEPGLDQGRMDGSTVLVTFDDGYSDCLHVALPLLERWGVGATFLITTGMLDARRGFWWDELERLLLQPGVLPAVLHCTTLNRAWELRDGAEYSPHTAETHRRWRHGRSAPTRRHEVYEQVWKVLLDQPAPTRDLALAELASLAGAPVEPRASHLPLTSDELVALGQSELSEIGSHTVSHSLLSGLAIEEQRHELETSKATLEEVLGRPVSSLSYPHGGYNPHTLRLAADAGYSVALTTTFGLLTGATDRFRIPRAVPPDVGGDAFAKWLRQILPPRRNAGLAS